VATKLLNMWPSSSRNDGADTAHADTVFFGQGNVSTSEHAFLITRSNRTNRGFGKFCKPISRSFMTDNGSILGDGISGIVSSRSKKKMSRITAQPIVTFVKNAQLWNHSISEIPCCARRNKCRQANASYLELAVSRIGRLSCPIPALTQLWNVFWNRTILVDVGPKSSLKW